MFFAFGPEIGYKVLTASGVVNDSGKPQALYAYAFKSGGTAGVISWFDGTSSVSPATFVYDHSGTINTTVFNNPSIGQVFPNGLYASFDANVTRVAVWARQILT